MECCGNIDNNKAFVNIGLQQMVTVGGHLVPFDVWTGLFCMDMRPPTDAELCEGPTELPQMMSTSDNKWDPTQIDSEPDFITCFDAVSELIDLNRNLPFDKYEECISDLILLLFVMTPVHVQSWTLQSYQTWQKLSNLLRKAKLPKKLINWHNSWMLKIDSTKLWA